MFFFFFGYGRRVQVGARCAVVRGRGGEEAGVRLRAEILGVALVVVVREVRERWHGGGAVACCAEGGLPRAR